MSSHLAGWRDRKVPLSNGSDMAERTADFTLTLVANPKIDAAIERTKRALTEYRCARAQLGRLLNERLVATPRTSDARGARSATSDGRQQPR